VATLDPRVWTVLGAWLFFVLLAAGAMLALGRKKRAAGAVDADIDKKPEQGGFWAKMSSYLVINLVFFLVAWTDYVIFAAVAGFIAVAASYEVARFSKSCRAGESIFARPVWYALSTGVIAATFAVNDANTSFRAFVGMYLCHGLITAFGGSLDMVIYRASLSTLTTVYIPLNLICLIYLKWIDPTGMMVVFVYCVIGATDSFAQVAGRCFGKRKITPVLSPNKTLEGAVGGLTAGVVVGLLLRSCLPYTPWYWVAFAALLVAVVAEVGDLMMSVAKRVMGIKDFGNALGAHGGFTDRFDSLMLASAAFFLLISVMPPHGISSRHLPPTIPVLQYVVATDADQPARRQP